MNRNTGLTVSSKSGRCRKDIKTIIEGVKVHVTWTDKAKDIVIRGYLICASDDIALDGIPAIRRTAKKKEDIDLVCNQIASTLVATYRDRTTGAKNPENANGGHTPIEENERGETTDRCRVLKSHDYTTTRVRIIRMMSGERIGLRCPHGVTGRYERL